ncbi:hypothetical protein [Streptomyces sp. t39]|uniref:hypothetical protein n=1 Tax=Streptomyces sp. t39 TaxID=1828156 RepID=UPI0011CD914F|nr:hypothetical protein [Streptomyces sp. t39]TXS55225.1 hypothetical protein EAO77_02690 [Streptomyces sp. t39]
MSQDVQAALVANRRTAMGIALALEPRVSAALAGARREAAATALADAATDLTHLPQWFTPAPGADWEIGVLDAATRVGRTAEKTAAEKDTRDSVSHTGESTPLVVSRFDVVLQPAPEEGQLLTIGAIAEDGRAVALVLDPETRARLADWLRPVARVWVARHVDQPTPLGTYDDPAAAQEHCEAELSAEHPAGTALLWRWDTDEDAPDDQPRELVARIDDTETPTGYLVAPVDVQSTYDTEATW